MNEKLEMPIEQFAEAVAKENARLTECLKAANKKHEHFEREYYLAKDRMEQMEATLHNTIDAWDFWQNSGSFAGFTELFESICEARSMLAGKSK